MKEYDFNEMQQMQEKALQRVKNMQTRANEVINEENKAQQAQNARDKTEPFSENIARENFLGHVGRMPNRNHIRMPVEMPDNVKPYESFKDYFEPENKRIAEQKAQSDKASVLDGVLNEPDKALLFALLLLMQSDKADEELMMSLLYIMI